MWQLKTILSVAGFIIFAHLTHPTYGWSWQCVDRQCVRDESPGPGQGPATSLELCRLTCGPYGALWPQPTGHTAISDKVVAINPSNINFNFSAVMGYSRGSVKEFMTAITGLFVDNLSGLCGGRCATVQSPAVTVYIATTTTDLALNWLTDESYSVEVNTRDNEVAVHISAETVYGARHGLETLTQLVTLPSDSDQLLAVSSARVSDKPVFPHRGLLLDTARHFLPLATLRRSIDAMAACKLNVLHWHVTDSHSFPLVLNRVPIMARYGAYSAEEVYTAKEVQELVQYARVRGVRLLLEFDMPAHAGNGWQWGPREGLGELAVCVNYQPWRQACLQPPCGQLNPANPNMYRVLRDIFRDVIDLLPQGDPVHFGGDEVFIPCWNQTKEITDWMKTQGKGVSQSDFMDVWGDFHKEVLRVWDEEVGNSKTPVVLWTSHLTDANIIQRHLDKNRFVIEAWISSTDPLAMDLLKLGYRVIFATKNAWYLDHGFWGRTQYYNWRVAYDNRLPRQRGVLGGEVAMWGELVDDNNVDGRVWPRATAAAERLWSDPETGNSAAEYRLVEQRRRLILRGVRPEAISPQWCDLNEGGCVGSSNTS